jgi:acyl-[acyl-carrier-protein]-phospholipid O-acyltransferase / long-chain-fatty-acid--[acyl-carrier-protein] ligase
MTYTRLKQGSLAECFYQFGRAFIPNTLKAAGLFGVAYGLGAAPAGLMLSLGFGAGLLLLAFLISPSDWVNRSFLIAAAAVALPVIGFKLGILATLISFGVFYLLSVIGITACLSHPLKKSFIKGVLVALYRVDINGLEHYHAANDNLIIIANHTSFLDIILLSAFLPERYSIAVNRDVAKQYWVRPFLALIDVMPIDPSNPLSNKAIIQAIKAGKKFIIFPEGRLNVAGAQKKVYESPALIADKTKADLLPVRIDGAQYSPFTRLRGKVNTQLFPKITINVLPVRNFKNLPSEGAKARRRALGTQLFKLMSDMMFESSNVDRTLFQALLDIRKISGGRFECAEDAERKPVSFNQLIARSFILGDAMAKQTAHGEHVGIMLPTTVTGILSFFALHAYGRTPVMINFTAGSSNILSACKTAQVKTIYTSKRFVDTIKCHDLIETLKQEVDVVYLESFRKTIGLPAKLKGLFKGRFLARQAYQRHAGTQSPTDPAVILFTSGSEGKPKGVLLSHRNILANIYQMQSRVDFTNRDIMFNALPIFHCFGLTAGSILPILSGIRVFLYPSPLHYRIVPDLVYDTNATILFGTDTFLNGYARYANPYDFYSIRYIFAGAEKLKVKTTKLYGEKFGVRVFEGYGVTETAPVVSTNTPMQNKLGTVGNPFPGLQTKLKPVEGIAHGGRLLLKGPNVMLGYLMPDGDGSIQAPEDGWYDTGDICDIDDEGFIHIKGRAKRFAKIGGEMVSLAAVEQFLGQLWPDHQHAVASVPDEKKGEQLMLLTTNKDAARDEIVKYVRDNGISELSIPKRIMIVGELPVLASGKVDYVGLQKKAVAA